MPAKSKLIDVIRSDLCGWQAWVHRRESELARLGLGRRRKVGDVDQFLAWFVSSLHEPRDAHKVAETGAEAMVTSVRRGGRNEAGIRFGMPDQARH